MSLVSSDGLADARHSRTNSINPSPHAATRGWRRFLAGSVTPISQFQKSCSMIWRRMSPRRRIIHGIHQFRPKSEGVGVQ